MKKNKDFHYMHIIWNAPFESDNFWKGGEQKF